MLHAIYFALLTNLGARTYAYRFTVLAEYVLETHQRLKNDLEFYIKEEEKRVAILKIYLNIFGREHGKAMEDVPSYVGNPINAFTLIKRLTSDVHYIKTHIKNGAEYAQNFTRYYDANYPSLEDLTSAAAVIAGFHHTSDLDVKQLVNGNLTNLTYSSSMTAGDCYELGQSLFKLKNDFVNGIAWMSEALRKYNEENLTLSHPFEAIHVYEWISHGYYELGDIKSSLYWLQNILNLDPNNSEAKRKVQDYQKRINYEAMTMCCSLSGFTEEFKNFSRPAT